MNTNQSASAILKELKAAQEIGVVAEVTLQTNGDTGEKFTSIKVESYARQPVVTSGGRVNMMKPFAWLTDKAEAKDEYQVGDPIQGRIIKVPSNPYQYETKGADGKMISVTLDHSWEFLPADLASRVQQYVPKRFRQSAEPTQESIPASAEAAPQDTEKDRSIAE